MPAAEEARGPRQRREEATQNGHMVVATLGPTMRPTPKTSPSKTEFSAMCCRRTRCTDLHVAGIALLGVVLIVVFFRLIELFCGICVFGSLRGLSFLIHVLLICIWRKSRGVLTYKIDIYGLKNATFAVGSPWCSRLSRESNTLKVSSSNLDGDIFYFKGDAFQCCLVSLLHLSCSFPLYMRTMGCSECSPCTTIGSTGTVSLVGLVSTSHDTLAKPC